MYFGCLFTHILNMTLFKEAVSHSKNFLSHCPKPEKRMQGKTGDPDNS